MRPDPTDPTRLDQPTDRPTFTYMYMYTYVYIHICIEICIYIFFLCVGQAILSRAGPFIWESLSFIYQTEAEKMRSVLFLSFSTPMWERLLVGTGRYWEVLVGTGGYWGVLVGTGGYW